jgi:two-component system sensor histidine kinase UhpB
MKRINDPPGDKPAGAAVEKSKTHLIADNVFLPTNGVNKQRSNSGYAGKPIAEIVVNGFFTVDKKWTVLYWNKAAEKILKVRANDIVGKNLWGKFADLLPLKFYAVYDKAFARHTPVYFEEYWGEMGAWFDVITYYCGDTLSVSFKDSSQSIDPEYPKTLEQQLQIKTELYKFVTEVTNDCLWEWNLITKELFWIDGGHKRVFGYQVENALIPQSFWVSLIHPDDVGRILAELNKVIKENSASGWEAEYRLKKANGEYAWVQDRGHIIYEDGVACRMIGATLDITEKVLLEKKLAAERLERERDITAMVFTAQEKERAAVGKELLDNINQVLGAAKLYMEMAKKDAPHREGLMEQACNYVVEVMESVRRISKALTPPFIQLMGLAKSIKILIDDVAAGYPVKFTINDDGMNQEALDEKLQLDIFRIVQQQVDNILRYANATHASIDISRQDDEIVLFISDNGNGCDITERKNGSGIKNIISRANLYQGSVTTLSSPGEGYTLQVIFKPDTRYYN